LSASRFFSSSARDQTRSFFEILKSDHTDPLSWMGLVHSEEIIELPHPARQLWLGQ